MNLQGFSPAFSPQESGIVDVCTTVSSFDIGSEDPNLGCQACVVSTLITELPAYPLPPSDENLSGEASERSPSTQAPL